MSNSTNPFDPANLKLSQSFTEGAAVKKVVTVVRVGKPDKQQFFRVHPDADFRMEAAVLELKEQSETYLVLPTLVSEIPSEIVRKVILTCITKQGSVFLWSVKLPDFDGKLDLWNQSALHAISIAEKQWIRLKSNRVAGVYDVLAAQDAWAEPEWPDLRFTDILKLAFQGKIIESIDHPIVQQLQGRG